MFGLIGKNLLNKIDLEVIIEKISTNPRRIILNEESKIEEGEKANITLFDPTLEWEVNKNDIKSKSTNTPFIKQKLKGKAIAIYNNSKFLTIN